MYASARDIRCDVAERLRPTPPVKPADSIVRNLRVANPSGRSMTINPDLTPYMVEPANMLVSRLHEALIFAGPARSGKTIWLVDGAVAYAIVDRPADTLIVQTNQKSAEDFSKTRISRAIEASPELKARLSPRAHDDNVQLKLFRSGMALRFGWPSLAELSGKDLSTVLMTDVDNITGDLEIDEAFGLALKRVQTFMSAGMLAAESNPAMDFADPNWRPSTPHEAPPAKGILSLYNRGDRRRWYWPCPECKEMFQAAPGIGGFHLPPLEELLERLLHEDVLQIAERHSLLHCTSCGVGIDGRRHKRAMNLAGRWCAEGQKVWPDGTLTGEPIRSRTVSYWLGGVAAAYQSWTSLVERYLQAVKILATTGDSQQLKSTTNVDQAMPFIPPTLHAERKVDSLRDRAEPLEQEFVPVGALFLIATIDVQAGKNAGFVVQVQGWGPALQWYPVDRFRLKSSRRASGALNADGSPQWLPIDPSSYLEDWERLIEKVLLRRYALADGSGRTMGIRLVLCDSGGKAGVTRNAYAFYRLLRERGLDRRFRLVKGASRADAPTVKRHHPDARNREDRDSGAAGDVPVIFINTVTLKDQIHGFAFRSTPGPGYMHFASWLRDSFYDELTAEVRTAQGWFNVSKRSNETMDLTVYSLAGVIALEADTAKFWAAPPAWARAWDENSEVSAPDGKVAPAPPRAPPPQIRKLRRSSYLENR